MKYAADELLATDRAVRVGLGVRDGQTIADRAAEIAGLVESPDPLPIHAVRFWSPEMTAIAWTILLNPGWPGIKAAYDLLPKATEQVRVSA